MVRHILQLAGGILGLSAALCSSAAAQAPPDRPQTLDSASEACLERASQARTARAVASLPDAIRRFQAGLGEGRRFYVTVRVWDQQGKSEQVFVAVLGVRGDTLVGQLDSETELVTQFHRGDRFLVLQDAVLDWTISQPDGTEEGNLLGKLMDTLQERMTRAPQASICALLAPR